MPTLTDVEGLQVFHLPGHHDQHSHGRLGGSAAHEAALRTPPLSPSATDTVREYGGHGHKPVNTMLRKNGGRISSDPKDKEAARITRGMDEAMAGQSLSHDMVVSRSVPDVGTTFGGHEPAVGLTWVDHGFVSTSTADRPFREVGMHEGAQLRITVPKGTKGFSVPNPVGYERGVLDRGEIVLDRGLTYRMTSVTRGETGTWHVDVEVLR